MRLIGTCAVCAYLIAFRIHDLDQNFPLLGEQIRDWSIALRPFYDLPRIGPRSINSGLDIGPVYYWCLWAFRVLSQPLLGILPHVGGIAQALFVTLSDGVLLVALAWRLQSWWLAATIVVFAATAPADASLSSVIWNPPIAVAFTKLATAMVLWPGSVSLSRAAIAVVFAVFAVQCHSSAVIAAIPLIGWTLWTVTRTHGVRGAGVVLTAGAVALATWLVGYLTVPPPATSGEGVSVASSLLRVAADPLGRLRVVESADAMSAAIEYVLLAPFSGTWLRWLLLAGGVLLAARIRDGAILAASLGPVLTAVIVFALWQGRFGESYWYLVIVPAAVLCCAGPVLAVEGRARLWGTALAMVITVAIQPARAHHTWTAARLPAYGSLVTGVRAAAATGVSVRGILPAFEVPQGMDPLFLYSLVGGKLDHTAPVVLVIEQDGRIRYEP